jgi:predicted LPLAT superfamily acyltransferase
MAGEERKWKGVTGGRSFGQKAMKITFSIVPVRAGYFVLIFVIPFYMLFARRGYLAIYRYFRKRHGYSVLKSFCKTYRNHYLFGQMILDRFAVYAGQKNFRLDNPENGLFLQMIDAPAGCIVAGAHVGNPELCGYLLRPGRKRINSLIFGGEAKEVQRNRSKILDDHNIRVIPVLDDLSHVFLINEALSNGEMVSMLCDRNSGSGRTVECDFLNGKADFPAGAFVIALQFEVPVIALFVLKINASLYRVHVISVPVPQEGNRREKINQMTRSFAKTVEGIVLKYPEQWFNFYNFWKNENVSLS